MRRHLGRAFVGVVLGAIGIAIVLIELLRKWIGVDPTGPHLVPVAIGAVFFVYGSYLLWPKPTKAAVTFIVDQGTRIVRVVRTGRRSTDMVAITDDGEVHPPVAVPIVTAEPSTNRRTEDPPLPPPGTH